MTNVVAIVLDDTGFAQLGCYGSSIATFRPGGGPVCDESLPLLAGGFRFTASVTGPAAPGAAEGVLFALGDLTGGFALFVAEGRLTFAFSRAGELLEVVADRPVPPGRQELGVVYAAAAFTLLHGDSPVGRLTFPGPLPFTYQHGGAGLRLGFDTGLPVSPRYALPSRWTGELWSVRLQTPGELPGASGQLRTALHAD